MNGTVWFVSAWLNVPLNFEITAPPHVVVTQLDSSCPISLLSKAVALSFGLRPIPWRPGGHLNVITKFGIFQPKEYTTGIVQACGLVDGDLGKCNVALVDDEELRPWGFQFLAAEKIVAKLLEKDPLLSEERAHIDLGFYRTSPKQSSAVPQTQAQRIKLLDKLYGRRQSIWVFNE
ncbi:hypothetical protein CSIM01_07251 [Colletotrichum simmondsii]|uniref:Uncharacterized protein n=1 Tax=Colletotrichum simmondsii TaxID=703756 RepID=A0A135RQ48_9PEZI|nr:hypothetical protein CSIM01_07251 [Colletotrichum simmondsii]